MLYLESSAVKSAEQDAVYGESGMFQQRFDPTPHFLCCFVGEGQSQDAPRRYPFSDERRNPVGDDGCLATPGSCIDQQGSASMIHNRPLGGCQASQIGLKGGGRGIGFGQIHG